jgi:hypothetical protein
MKDNNTTFSTTKPHEVDVLSLTRRNYLFLCRDTKAEILDPASAMKSRSRKLSAVSNLLNRLPSLTPIRDRIRDVTAPVEARAAFSWNQLPMRPLLTLEQIRRVR